MCVAKEKRFGAIFLYVFSSPALHMSGALAEYLNSDTVLLLAHQKCLGCGEPKFCLLPAFAIVGYVGTVSQLADNVSNYFIPSVWVFWLFCVPEENACY